MDCGTAGTAAGIDPKILDNWQSDTAFSLPSPWEHAVYEQPLEWDTSQDSSEADGELVDLNSAQPSRPKDRSHVPHLGPRNDLSSDGRCAFLIRPPTSVV
jgi:hypothetical protein